MVVCVQIFDLKDVLGNHEVKTLTLQISNKSGGDSASYLRMTIEGMHLAEGVEGLLQNPSASDLAADVRCDFLGCIH